MKPEIKWSCKWQAFHKVIQTSNLLPIEELSGKGKLKYGDDYNQTLFDGVITDLFDEFKASVLDLVDNIIDLITNRERYYWLIEKNYVFYYFNNLDKKTLFE